MLGEKKELSSLIEYQKNFIIIEDNVEYKRCTVKINRQGIVLRDIVKGSHIKTKKQQVCKAGQLLVAEIDAKVGGYGIVPQNLDGAIVSSHYFLFNIDTIKLYRDYLKYFLKTDQFFSQIKAQGTTNYAAIRPKDVLITQIPLPALDEQQRIASVVDDFTVNNKVLDINIKKSKSILDQIRQSILQEAVQGKLVPQEPNDEPASELLKKIKAEKERLIKEKKIKKEKPLPPIKDEKIPYELPEKWEWVRLYDVILDRPRNGYSPRCVDYPTSIKTLTLSATTSGKFKPSFYKFIDEEIPPHSHLWLRSGDILIQRSNSIDYVGVCCRVDFVEEKYIYPDLMMKIQAIHINDEYLNLALSSKTCRDPLKLKATGTSSSMPKINQKDVMDLIIPIPPLNEQKRIVAKVNQLMQICDELEASITQAQKDSELLMHAVLQEAYGGN